MDRNRRILPGHGSDRCFRYHSEKDKDVRRRPGSVRYGAAGIPYADCGNVLRSMWERGWSFIKKAGTIITLSTIFVWFTSFFGWVDGSFGMLTEDQMSHSILAYIGKGICWIFAPLGWGDWQATVAAVTGLVAKENIVATMGILYGGGDGVYSNLAAAFTGVAGMSFLIFNLLCAPCFAAMGAIKREMNNTKCSGSQLVTSAVSLM